MSNLYGGITYNSHFVFDKIYTSYNEMDAANDGVLVGRYVLIQYCPDPISQDRRSWLEAASSEGDITSFPDKADKTWTDNDKAYYDNYVADGRGISKDRLIYRKEFNDKRYVYRPITNLNNNFADSTLKKALELYDTTSVLLKGQLGLPVQKTEGYFYFEKVEEENRYNQYYYDGNEIIPVGLTWDALSSITENIENLNNIFQTEYFSQYFGFEEYSNAFIITPPILKDFPTEERYARAKQEYSYFKFVSQRRLRNDDGTFTILDDGTNWYLGEGFLSQFDRKAFACDSSFELWNISTIEASVNNAGIGKIDIQFGGVAALLGSGRPIIWSFERTDNYENILSCYTSLPNSFNDSLKDNFKNNMIFYSKSNETENRSSITLRVNSIAGIPVDFIFTGGDSLGQVSLLGTAAGTFNIGTQNKPIGEIYCKQITLFDPDLSSYPSQTLTVENLQKLLALLNE